MTLEQLNALSPALIAIVKNALREEFSALRDEFVKALDHRGQELQAKIDQGEVKRDALARRVARLESSWRRALLGWAALMFLGGAALKYLTLYFPQLLK